MTENEHLPAEREAIAANEAFFNEETTRRYADVSPHIKYASLRHLYLQLVGDVFAYARRFSDIPTVLDLGAGEGSATLPFLELGARVVAVDVSDSQLAELERKCSPHKDRLEVRQVDISKALVTDEQYDVLVMNSCLHHIPDYISVIQAGLRLLSKNGQFFSFQDPVRYDTMNVFSRWFDKTGYFSWRVFQGDLVGGVSRALRRARGIYLKEGPTDNAEYHVVRNGVDQAKIVEMLSANGFECRLIRYFSTQGSVFQSLGSALGISNTFGIIAKYGP